MGHHLWRVLLAALMKWSGGFPEEIIAQDWGSHVDSADSEVLKPPGLVHDVRMTRRSQSATPGEL